MAYNYLIKNNVKTELANINNIDNETLIKIKKDLLKYEESTLRLIGNTVGDINFISEMHNLVSLQNLKEHIDPKKTLINNRKEVIEKAIKLFTKNCIDNNETNLATSTKTKDLNYEDIRSFDHLVNMINNYYDSLYTRFTNANLKESLPEYDANELKATKKKVYTKIKKNTGKDLIENEFKKSGYKTFAGYCYDVVPDLVGKFNDKVVRLADEKYPNKEIKDVKLSTLGLKNSDYADLHKKIPTMLSMLKNSYYNRSKTERFFSYFPFINPRAKEERKAINMIFQACDAGCYAKIDRGELELYKVNELKNLNKNFYANELEKIDNLVEDKVNIIVESEAVVQNENVLNKVEVLPEIKEVSVSEENEKEVTIVQ